MEKATKKPIFTQDEMEQMMSLWGEAMRRKYQRPLQAEPSLAAAPPLGRQAIEHTWEHRQFSINIKVLDGAGSNVCFTGHSAEWAGRLVYAIWTWHDQQPDEGLSCFVLMPEQPFMGEFLCEVCLPVRIAHFPEWAVVDPVSVSPVCFVREWEKATVKPSKTQLEAWVNRQPQEAQAKWRRILKDLNG